jgi:hypothetical protein
MYRGCLRVTIMTLALAVCATASAEQHLREATVLKTPAGHEITFKLTEPGDVTVRSVDAEGNVVRHLVSGMLGLKKAAKPFAPGCLRKKSPGTAKMTKASR